MEYPRYFLRISSDLLDQKGTYQEVTLEKFCAAERAAGFYPKGVHPSRSATTLATAGFGGGGIEGTVAYSEKSLPGEFSPLTHGPEAFT